MALDRPVRPCLPFLVQMAERWFRDLGNKLEATAYDLGGNVLSAANTVATTIKDAPANITSLISIDSSSSDFDRIR